MSNTDIKKQEESPSDLTALLGTRGLKFRSWDIEIKQYRSPGTISICGSGNLFILTGKTKNNLRIEYINNIVIECFTGLKDKHGTEIYEGDIVTDGYDNGVVKYYKNVARYLVDFMPYEESPQSLDSNLMWAEVIGNINETPGLMLQ